MIKFELGKSYIWIFAIFAAVFAIAIFVISNIKLGAAVLLVLTLVLVSSEIRSGIVLDSWWRAEHPIGSWQYKLGLAWHLVATIFFVGFAIATFRM